VDILKLFSGHADLSSVAIAITGAVISIVGALYLSKRRIDADFRVRRIELTNLYAENLLKMRLDKYQEPWFYVSHYRKIINGLYLGDGGGKQVADLTNLLQLHVDMNNWNSKHSLIFSENTARASGNLRRTIQNILETTNNNQPNRELNTDEGRQVYDAMGRFEIALRIDIGILEVDDFENREIVRSYKELRERKEHANRITNI